MRNARMWPGLSSLSKPCSSKRGQVTLTTGFPVSAAWRTNLLEENQTALATDGKCVHLYVKPYEIATVRLVPGL